MNDDVIISMALIEPRFEPAAGLPLLDEDYLGEILFILQ